jgi:predicted RNA binding protein YcfA (HicA-like mRNA interferase family)
LLRIGWSIKRQAGTSHQILARPGWSDFVFAFHDREEIGPKILARIAKNNGLSPDDL